MNNLLGKKIGMTQVFDEAGNVVPVTVIEAGPCVVTQVKTVKKDGYNAVQVGFEMKKREFRVEKPEEFESGQEIKVEIFKPGDIVSVSGASIGKGFAGTVKRYHHARGPMSHGSKSHRIPGSIGAGTTPGRVWKGRPMPGRMGAEKVTNPSLRVVSVDAAKNILMLLGSVPGKRGNLVTVTRTKEGPAPAKEEKVASSCKK